MRKLKQEQVVGIVTVIQGDATITSQLFDGKGGACVLGGLYAAKHGIDLATLDPELAKVYAGVDSGALNWGTIGEEWGLDRHQVERLWKTNDEYSMLVERRAALIILVESWGTDDPLC